MVAGQAVHVPAVGGEEPRVAGCALTVGDDIRRERPVVVRAEIPPARHRPGRRVQGEEVGVAVVVAQLIGVGAAGDDVAAVRRHHRVEVVVGAGAHPRHRAARRRHTVDVPGAAEGVVILALPGGVKDPGPVGREAETGAVVRPLGQLLRLGAVGGSHDKDLRPPLIEIADAVFLVVEFRDHPDAPGVLLVKVLFVLFLDLLARLLPRLARRQEGDGLAVRRPGKLPHPALNPGELRRLAAVHRQQPHLHLPAALAQKGDAPAVRSKARARVVLTAGKPHGGAAGTGHIEAGLVAVLFGVDPLYNKGNAIPRRRDLHVTRELEAEQVVSLH